jgi:2-polyprenyl-3-methyl-5-hydroxy-6-metoxy-1,4-benzoquinol methylase
MNCRHCDTRLEYVLVDLVNAPLSNDLINQEQLDHPIIYYPLKIYVCHNCFLVQVAEMKKAEEIFHNEYPYFSSYSKSWLKHAKNYVDMMVDRFKYNKDSFIIEIASNDGYLLQYFNQYEIPVLGIEPTVNTASIALQKGINTLFEFFNSRVAEKEIVCKDRQADLVIGNNVLAHVPDINDFVKGVKMAMKSNGIATFEFPHLIKLIEDSQFDTIYHEHFSYLSFTTVVGIFEKFGLEMFDVEELPTHGGSLRIFAKHQEDDTKEISSNVAELLQREKKLGIKNIGYYINFQEKVDKIKYEFLTFLLLKKLEKKKVIGYGAAAKGNTLLNYCGVKGGDLIKFVVDASPHKQNKYFPASHIPIFSNEKIIEYKPDYIIILPWNLKEEIIEEFSYVREWGCKFVVFIPSLKIY